MKRAHIGFVELGSDNAGLLYAYYRHSSHSLKYKEAMKKLIIIVLLSLSQATYGSIDTTVLNSKITNVTVFFTGAQISRNAKIKFSKGKHIVLIKDLPQTIEPNSIQVKGIKNVQILSVKHRIKYDTKKSEKYLDLEKQIDEQEEKVTMILNTIQIYELEERVILQNSSLGSVQQGISTTEILAIADLYRERLNEIRSKH